MRTRNLNKLAFVYFLLLVGYTSAWAQCGCKFTVPAGTGIYTFDGAVQGAKPGDVICLASGARERIIFQNIQGNPDNYITIVNCGGQALIGGPNANQAMSFGRSKYYHLTGTGDAGFEYGIKIVQSKASTQGIHNFDLSSDFEIDHVEIQNTGFAGIMAKSDPSKDCNNYIYERTNPTMTNIFIMRNLKIHHNYLHEIGGEGIYCGNSFYTGATAYCPSRIQYPHEVRDVEIWDNIFESCSWESIQVGSGVQGILIHDNKLYNYGAANVPSQNGGIQVGVGTSAKVYNNFIKKGSGIAIFVQGIGNISVYNNVLVNTGTYAILSSLQKTPLATDIVPTGFTGPLFIMNNTIINPSPNDGVVKESVVGPLGNMMFNNLVVGGQSNWLKLRGDTDWQKGNNVYIANMADAKFVNPTLDDYHLAAGSPAINAGKDVSAQGITFDFDNKGRPAGGSFDLGAFEFNGNQKPVVTVEADKIVTLPTAITTLTGSATDADGTIGSLLWTKTSGPAASLANPGLPVANLSALVAGTYVFRLTATDNGSETGFKEITVTVVDPAANQTPVANSGGDRTVILPTATTQLTGSATDVDGFIASYKWTKITAFAATMANANTPTMNLSALVEGTHIFRLTVTDNKGATDFKDAQVFVQAAGANSLPTASAGGDKTVNLPTVTVTLTGLGTDSDGSIKTYAWSKVSGPAATIATPSSASTVINGLSAGTYVFRLTVTDNALGQATDDVTVTVVSTNKPPKSVAGGDKTIQLPTAATTLPGTGSDDDGIVKTYAWTRISGPNTPTLTNANTATLSLSGLIAGNYVYRLTVTDDLGATGTDDVMLTVQAANIAPTANPGPTKNLVLPINTVTLTGTATDPDGTIASYLWEKVTGPTVTIGPPINAAAVTLTNLVEGSYTFRFTATDNLGASGFNTVNVIVFPPTTNVAPVVDAGGNVTLTLPANTTTITGTATDADGTIASYLWEKVSGPTATLGGTTTISLALSNLVAGTYVFRFTATDDDTFSSSDEVQVKVSAANQNPTVNIGPTITVVLPATTTDVTAIASDPDGTVASYHWQENTGPNTATLAGAGTDHVSISGLIEGNYIFRCTVTDNLGGTGFDDVNVNVQSAANVNPVAEAGQAYNIFLPTNSVNLGGSGTDSDGTIAGYTWTKIVGPAATLTNDNTATLTVTDMIAGTYIFRLKVTDNDGGTAIDEATVTVNAATANQAPVANAGPDIALSLPVNSTNLIGSGSDVDGSIATYSWLKVTGPPATMTNQSTAVLSIADLVDGIYVFRLTVTDDRGAMASDVAQITVLPASVNQSPVVTTGIDVTLILPDNSMSLTAVAADVDGSVASYQWSKVLGPTATTSGETTSSLSISDLVEGTYTFRVVVTDDDGAQGSDDIKVSVLPVGSNQPPIASAGSDKILFLPNDAITLSGTGTDNDGSIASYSWDKMSGPPVTAANEATSSLSVTGMVAGEYIFRLTVTDDEGLTAFDEVKVTVFPGTVNQSPVANAGSNKTIVLPTDDSSLAGSGFDPDGSIVKYAWVQKSGPATTISGTDSPTLSVSGLSEGVFQFELTVTDDDGSTGSDVTTVTVIPEGAAQPPIADAGFDQLVKLPATTLSIVGSGIDPDGTIATYLWAKKSGASAVVLANEGTSTLSVSGLDAGSYTFTLTVTDNDGLFNSDDMRVTVVPAGVNANPIVDAGKDVFIRQPATTATITATANDVDGTIDTYTWTKVSGPAASLAGDNTASLILSGLVLGDYTFRIEVTDNSGASASDEVEVTVAEPGTNQPPVVLAGSPVKIATPASTAVLNGSASDNDGSIASLLWTQTNGPNSATMANAGSATLSISNLVLGLYSFRLTANDNENAAAFSETTVEVVDGFALPQVFAGNDTTLFLPDNAMELIGSVTTLDGFISLYTWTQTEGDPVKISGEYPEVFLSDMLPGSYKFVLTAVNDKGDAGNDDIEINVVEGKSNPLGASIVFTPNGDLVNDVWVIRNSNMITGCPIAIFNSLGKKIYSASDYQNDWNGTFEGQVARDGDYYFVFDCAEKTYSGALRIVR